VPDEPVTAFADLGLRPELLQALAALGYEEPTPVQREAVPPLLAGRDLLGQAATGTGKTAAFALPLLQRLAAGRDGRDPQALVLVPTRELATQVSQAVHRYGRDLGARVTPVYGGQPFRRQIQVLSRGVDVVVATPGRARDHLERGTLRLHGLGTVVLDEADEMLDMGFAEDLEAILDAAPAERQTVLFSATLPARLGTVVERHLRDAVRLELAPDEPPPGEAPRVREVAHVVHRAAKPAALGRVLDLEQPDAALVFCRTRAEVDELTETLNGRGYRAEALHGGMTQEQRERVMGRLRSGAAELLVATDVAARGLDVELLTHVVNYDVPAAPEAYVHRTGRVGRAGREGVAITLAQPREHRMLKAIERVTGRPVPVEALPTVADLRARRLELTRAALQQRLEDGDLDRFRPVLESLADDGADVLEVGLAAVALAHEVLSGPGDGDEEDIPEPTREQRRPPRERREPSPASSGKARLFVGAGRAAGIRPQDLVGAITGESGLRGKDIGAIQIADRFALVEVPEDAADAIVAALRGSTIKGRKAFVRRDREQPQQRPAREPAPRAPRPGAAGG